MYKETVEWIPIYSDYKNLLIIRFTSVPLWRTTVWRFLKKTENKELPFDPAIPLLAYTLRKPELKETRVPQCSLQHCL